MIKPDDNILIGSKLHGNFEILESNTHIGGWNQQQFSVAAFDEDLTSIFELCAASEYFIIRINQKSNIYRYTNYFANAIYNSKLRITNVNTNEDVTDLYTIELSNANQTWELFVKDIPEGTYKFTCPTGDRVDSEWFIEKSGTSVKKTTHIKQAIYNEIINNELIQKHIPVVEMESGE